MYLEGRVGVVMEEIHGSTHLDDLDPLQHSIVLEIDRTLHRYVSRAVRRSSKNAASNGFPKTE